MAAEESLIHLLYLFDSLWFENQITKNSNPPENNNDLLPKLPRILIRDDQVIKYNDKSVSVTTSQESLSSGDSENLLSPNSVLMSSHAKLEIKRESSEPPEKKQEVVIKTRRRRRSRTGKGGLSSKSLSELEFEEVKGFMDLGFVFSEGDKNSSLVKIIPGLQRFGEGEKENNGLSNADRSLIKRPYLSQAWEIMEYKRKEPKWKINADVLGNEMNMKHQLRFWAKSVASAVK